MQEESKVFQTFFYQGHQIRTVEHNGETWWVAIDVCNVLEIANVSMAISGYDGTGNTGLDDDEKDDIMIHDVAGRKQATLCVNEPGLYHLISKSRTPEASEVAIVAKCVVHRVLMNQSTKKLPLAFPRE